MARNITHAILKTHTRSETISGSWKPLNCDEKWSLFHFKIFFRFLRYSNSWILVDVRKRLIRKLKLISKFMTSHAAKRIIAIHILLDISRSKRQSDNKVLSANRIQREKISIFLQKSCRKRGRENSFRPLFVFDNAFYEVKASG